MKKFFLAFVFFVLTSPTYVYAWWDLSHQTIAAIADETLTEKTRREITRLLGVHLEGLSTPWVESWIVSASWADSVKPVAHNFDEYGPACHYINVHVYTDELNEFEKNKESYKKQIASLSFGNENNALSCMRKFVQVLKGPSDDQKKALALRYLIHVLGDLHQPMHVFSVMSRDPDDKGNKGGVDFLLMDQIVLDAFHNSGEIKIDDLHALWDANFGEFSQYKPHYKNLGAEAINSKEVAKELLKNSALVSEARRVAQSSTVWEDWAFESLQLGVTVGYRGIDTTQSYFHRGSDFLDFEEYTRVGKDVLKKQQLIAGFRLGFLLNVLFDN